MKLIKMKKLALALGSLAILGASVQAHAVGSPFVINPSAILPGNTTYDGTLATSVTGRSSELLHFSADGMTTTGSGYFNFGTFDPNVAADSGLGNAYGAYLVFQLTATGAFGGPQTVTKLDFQLYGDPGFANKNSTRTTFTEAGGTTTTAGTEATITQNKDDILLAFGSLLTGVAGVNSQGGLSINSNETFALCNGAGTAVSGKTTFAASACTSGAGKAFFVSPDPFYQLVFDAFNNTTQNFTQNADGTVAVSAGGTADFRNVPEPGTIALLGIAATAAGLASRRRSK